MQVAFIDLPIRGKQGIRYFRDTTKMGGTPKLAYSAN
jgi:hypothetical protein